MNKKFNIYSKFEKAPSIDEEKGFLEIEGWASKAYEAGKPIIDRDGEHVDTASLDLSNCKVLLAQHNWDAPIGKVELSHRPEGIWLKGKVYKALDEKMFFAIKEGVIDSFSIGFTVSDYEYIKVDGEDFIQLKNGSVHEVSCVSIPANIAATISSVKSIVQDNTCVGLQCSIKALKEMNPNCTCEMNKKELKGMKDIKEIIKGLTLEETEQQTWNEYEKLSFYIKLLAETIDDNFWAGIWADEVDGNQVKANIKGAFDSFMMKLEEFSTLQVNVDGTQTKGNNDMNINKSLSEVITKEAEETVVETEEGQDITTPEQEEETPEQDNKDTVETVEEDSESLEDNEDESLENITEEETEGETEEVPAEESTPSIPSIQNTIGHLSTVNFDSLSIEEIEGLYNSASEIVERIEAYVKADVNGEE